MLHNITKQVDDGFFLNEDDAFKNLFEFIVVCQKL